MDKKFACIILSFNVKFVLSWLLTELEVLSVIVVCDIITFMGSHYDSAFRVLSTLYATFKGYFTSELKGS